MRIYSTDKFKTNFLNQKNKPKPEPFRTLLSLTTFLLPILKKKILTNLST